MKIIPKLLLAFLIFPAVSVAQKTITAESLKASINSNTPISLSDVLITGDLDLTKLDNMKLESKQDGRSKTYISTVTSTLRFSNCRFSGKVLGYFNPGDGKYHNNSNVVYNTNFTAPVTFEKCTFDKEVTFKYSSFSGKTSFAGSHFSDIAVFKYTKFAAATDFSESTFKGRADFKYVDFPEGFDFSNATFDDGADFKYAQMLKSGRFVNCKFKNDAGFKYANFGDAVNLTGVRFDGSSDFKYTQLNNRRVSLNELISR